MTTEWFANQINKWASDPEFVTEQLVLKINEEICELMATKNITRSELARRLGVRRQFITKTLNGNPNLTLLTLVKIGLSLDASVNVTFNLQDASLVNRGWTNIVPKPATKNKGIPFALANAA